MRRFFASGMAALLVAVAVAGCADDKNSISVFSPPSPAEMTVSAIDNLFRPTALSVAAGTEVVFVNDGRNDHNIVPADGSASFGVAKEAFRPGQVYRHTFTEPGTYAFFCSIHGTSASGMVGTVTVTGADGSTGTTTTAAAPATTAAPAGPAAAAADADGVIAVPSEIATIQGAVDAAKPGDLVLVSPGVYHEAVNVTTDNLTIRGLDRNETILDGQFALDNGVRVLGANGVAVENMTARNYTANGFFWTSVTGYRGSYLTTYRTGDYGIYAFDAVNGLIEHSYASGSPDAGVYIGECYQCNAVIDDMTSEYNGLGYSGTNSGGNLYIVNSIFRYNRAGIVPNSGSYELCYPERRTTIVGNLVYSNNQPDTPAIDVALLAMGNGILSAGGVENVIERNLVYDHDKSGIGLVPFLEEDPNDNPPPDSELDRPCSETKNDPLPNPAPTGAVLWDSKRSQVRDNVVSDSRLADLLVASAGTDLATLGHCFSGNTFSSSAPSAIEQLAPCSGTGSGDWNAGAADIVPWLNEVHPPSADYKVSSPVPPRQPTMPDAATAPARPATDMPPKVDLAAIGVPAHP